MNGWMGGWTNRRMVRWMDQLMNGLQHLIRQMILSCLIPHCQNEFPCEAIHIKNCFTCTFIFMQIELIFK